MSTNVARDEFQHLESRMTIAEREVDGEKMVTRHILEQTRRNSDDLAAIKTRLDRVESKVDSLDRKFDGLNRKVDELVKGLPTIIGEAVHDVLQERDRRA